MSLLTEFYDPASYESNAGYAPRVDEVYAEVLADLAPGARLMELGCGIGNVLLPFARRGIRVIGVDRSAAMLARLRELAEGESADLAGRVRCEQVELPDLPSVDSVDAVILPNDLISHLLDDTALDLLWQNIRKVLAPGGRLVLDVERFDVRHLGAAAGPAGLAYRSHGFVPYSGDRVLRVDEQSAYDVASGILCSTFRYEVQGPAGYVEKSWYRVLRAYPRRVREVTATLESAGFRIARLTDAVFPAGLDHILVVAELA